MSGLRVCLALRRRWAMIRPFIEVGTDVYTVVGWDVDGIVDEPVTVRKLDEQELQRYRRLRRELDIELWVNFVGGY